MHASMPDRHGHFVIGASPTSNLSRAATPGEPSAFMTTSQKRSEGVSRNVAPRTVQPPPPPVMRY